MKKFQQTREVIKYSLKYISGKTLDLGAGSAKYRDIIKQRSSEYIAFDMVDGENIDVVGSVFDLPFDDDQFDTIISTQVLEHIEKPWIMIREIHRTLKKDGICILTAPFLQPYHRDPGDFFRYTKDGLVSLFKDQGFIVIECDYYTEVFSTIAEFIKFIFFNPYKGKDRGRLRWKILRTIQKVSKFLDRFTKSSRIYANSYIIVRK